MLYQTINNFLLRSFFLAIGMIYAHQSLALCTPDNNPPSRKGVVPTKIIKIYNNTDYPIYPLIETNTNDVDEWLQAYFGVCDSSLFKHTINYRIYVNGLEGVKAHRFVALNVPVYTKLSNHPDPAYGTDQYINWWNGGRIKIYNSLITYKEDLAKDSKASTTGVRLTCADIKGSQCKTLDIYFRSGALPDNTPSQLTEYTFAGAPLKENGNGLRTWAIQDVDWDVSYVDSVYLPIAMGVIGNRYIGYTGTTSDVDTFKNKISSFLQPSRAGYNWSHYIIPGDKDNIIIKLPGTYHYMRGVLNNTVTTPSNDSPLFNLFRLWKSCFKDSSSPNYFDFDVLKDDSKTLACAGVFQMDLWKVQQFFLQNLKQYEVLSKNKKSGCDYDKLMRTLKDQKTPLNVEMLSRIYGWVPFNDYCNNASAVNSLCKTSHDANDPNINNPDPTKCTQEYHEVHKIYRDLEYAYTGKKYPNQTFFNPYIQLIHGKEFLNMRGYAFSIDDAVGNMQEFGDGLIIAVGGANGLENTQPYDPKSAVIVTMGNPQPGRPTWKKFAACDASENHCIPNSILPENSTNVKLGTIEKFPLKVVIQDSADRIYEFIIKEGPNENNQYTLAPDGISGCKVTDKLGKPVSGWCAPFLDKDRHGTPYAHTVYDENDKPVNYVSTNDPPQ